MKILAKLIKYSAVAVLGVSALGLMMAVMVYDSREQFFTDAETVARGWKISLFDSGIIEKLDEEDVMHVYQSNCYRRCHGEEAMITAVLPPAGWTQVVERMRLKENVDISGRKADVIIQYLEQRYPTTRSKYDYQTRKKVQSEVWRNDAGGGDVYADIIMASSEYLKVVGAENLISEYNIADYMVFIISLSVHDGIIDLMDMDSICSLRVGGKTVAASPPWILRFQTEDKHHYESLVRFKRGDIPVSPNGDTDIELVVRGVGGIPERVFKWKLPIKYPEEFYG